MSLAPHLARAHHSLAQAGPAINPSRDRGSFKSGTSWNACWAGTAHMSRDLHPATACHRNGEQRLKAACGKRPPATLGPLSAKGRPRAAQLRQGRHVDVQLHTDLAHHREELLHANALILETSAKPTSSGQIRNFFPWAVSLPDVLHIIFVGKKNRWMPNASIQRETPTFQVLKTCPCMVQP